jgi:translation initiation factor 2 subunit 1
MIFKRASLPSEGELVIATVDKVFDYGSYVKLDEYRNLQAYLPWSEVASKWVRNIRSLVREGQKIVVKVIRVDRKKGTVDVSLKKVNDDERRKKLVHWKREQKADKILELVASKLNKKEEEAYVEVGWKLEDRYGDVMTGLEEGLKSSGKALVEAGVPEAWIKPLLEEISKHSEERKVKVSKTVTLRSFSKQGINDIVKVLSEALQYGNEDYKVKVYTIGAPRYRIEVIGPEPKEGGQLLEEILERLSKAAESNNMDFKVVEQ